jgi:hypothetical protein
MDLQELTNLIQIRQYVVNTVNNLTIDRPTVTAMNNTLLLLDKKIIGLLTDKSFKDFIGYDKIEQVVKDVANANDIKARVNAIKARSENK